MRRRARGPGSLLHDERIDDRQHAPRGLPGTSAAVESSPGTEVGALMRKLPRHAAGVRSTRMRAKVRLAAFGGLCLWSLVTFAALPAGIQQVMTRHKIPLDAVSLLVQAVDEDTPRLALNVDTPRNPASTVKLVTTWTALDMLGPTYTWPTRLYATGPVRNGVLDGDLVIKGYGDPYLVLEDLWAMLGQLRRLGVREITGDLVLDDSHFSIEEHDPGAFDGQTWRLYNVLPSALLFNFKSVDFVVRPDPAQGKVAISTVPELPNLTIANRIRLSQGACRGNATQINMNVTDPSRADHVEFSGQMPAACGALSLPRSVLTAPAYAYGVFKALWPQWGGSLAGGYRVAAKPHDARLLLTWHSRQLGELIRPLNKWSNNVMTRMLLFTLGESRHPPPITRAQGAQALIEHLTERGLDTTGLEVDNGSGLSRTTRVSARFMVELLGLAWRSPTMPEYLASLSIVGKDGTTRRRFRNRPEAGRMHLKTGSIADVSAVGGYVHTPQGRTFMVSVLINHRGANWGIGTAVQDAVLSWTFQQR